MAISEAPATVLVDKTPTDTVSYFDWPAILAGVVIASAISLILLTFGSAIGLSMTSAREGQSASLFWIGIVGGLWVLWVQLVASSAGGYLTGRMRRRTGDATEAESDLRDGSNGLVVWGLATLVAAFVTYAGLTGAANVAAETAGAAAQVAAATDPSELLIDRTLRGRPDAPVVTDADRAAIGRIVVGAATSEQGLDQADRDYLAGVIAARAGISPEEAATRIDQVVAQAKQIEEDARAAAERARRASIVAAFMAAASLALGAAAAYFAATLGGNHRDKNVVVEGWYRPW